MLGSIDLLQCQKGIWSHPRCIVINLVKVDAGFFHVLFLAKGFLLFRTFVSCFLEIREASICMNLADISQSS